MSTNQNGDRHTPWAVVFTRQAAKDARLLARAGLAGRAQELLDILKADPFQPPYEKLLGNFAGAYSRRINVQHRLVYQVHVQERTVKVIRMWSHYE